MSEGWIVFWISMGAIFSTVAIVFCIIYGVNFLIDYGDERKKFFWQCAKYCVCQKCEKKLIMQNRERLNRKYARRMYEKLENHVETELEAEYRRNYGN